MLYYKLADFYWLYLYTVASWSFIYLLLFLIGKGSSSLKISRDAFPYLLFLSVSFSFLGITIGLLIGLSLSPVIGVVIPALLTFFGGFITYSFVFKNNSRKDGYVMLLILFSISLFLIIGVDYGSKNRIAHENEAREEEEIRKKNYDIFKYNLEHEIDNYASPSLIEDSIRNPDTFNKTESKQSDK